MLYHLEDIEKIREVESRVKKETTIPVFDISHWDSGNEYQNLLKKELEIPSLGFPFNYVYSYEINEKKHIQIGEKLHINNESYSTIIMPSSTLTIVNIANFLQKNELNHVCILQPSYFTVEPCLRAFNINVTTLSLTYKNNKFSIPIDKILKKGWDAIWLTSPVFCSSVYFDESEYEKLNTILKEQIYLICDESLASLGREIHPHLNSSKYLFNIYSPHKVLGTNALKFSCLISHKEYLDFFNRWIDIFSGGLTIASAIAVEHFLTPNYNLCLDKSMAYLQKTKSSIIELLKLHSDKVFWTNAKGQYMTIFYPDIPYNVSTKLTFIKSLIENTKVSLLPGYLEGYFSEFGFCFRINLTLDRNQIIIALNKVLRYLENEYL